MPLCLIGMGANLGDPAETLRAALDALAGEPGFELVAASKFLATRPIGGPEGQGEFLNACATIRTDLSPRETIAALLRIEANLGRTRRTRWEARRLDLDLLLYGEEIYRAEGIEVPHPRMASRRFVLDPAEEIAAEMVHPITGWTIGAIARHLRSAPNVAMLTGLDSDGRGQVVEQLRRLPFPEGRSSQSARFRLIELLDAIPGRQDQVAFREAFLEPRDVPDGSAATVPVVLDFWPGEPLLWMDKNSREEDRLLTVLNEIPAPKLLIDLYVPDGDPTVEERWLDLLRSRAPAPWIRVDATNPQQATTEILAALEAMQG